MKAINKAKGLLAISALIVSSLSFGIYNPSWERPILTAPDMVIEQGRFGFKDLDRAGLTLTQRDGSAEPTGIIVNLSYVRKAEGDSNRTIRLAVTNVSKDACGSKTIVAQLPTSKPTEPRGLYHRFSVVLTDHSQRLCEDYRPYMWEAKVREGYGWCGTMDATMSLYGNPEPVNTIESK